jgi:hypothetical protein
MAGARGANSKPCLLLDPAMPRTAKAFLILAAVGSSALIFTSNFSVGAVIYASVHADPPLTAQTPPIPLYEVTLKHSISDLWNAHATAMSILIAGEPTE